MAKQRPRTPNEGTNPLPPQDRPPPNEPAPHLHFQIDSINARRHDLDRAHYYLRLAKEEAAQIERLRHQHGSLRQQLERVTNEIRQTAPMTGPPGPHDAARLHELTAIKEHLESSEKELMASEHEAARRLARYEEAANHVAPTPAGQSQPSSVADVLEQFADKNREEAPTPSDERWLRPETRRSLEPIIEGMILRDHQSLLARTTVLDGISRTLSVGLLLAAIALTVPTVTHLSVFILLSVSASYVWVYDKLFSARAALRMEGEIIRVSPQPWQDYLIKQRYLMRDRGLIRNVIEPYVWLIVQVTVFLLLYFQPRLHWLL